MKTTKRTNTKQGVTYLAVGAGTALLELGLFWALHSVVGLPIEVANVVAVITATACNFALNRTLTFRSTSNPLRSAALYALLFVANLSISTFAIAALAQIGWHPAIAKALLQGCIALWNFFIYRKVIFV